MKQLPRPQELARRFWSTIRYYSKGLYHRVAQDHAFLLSGGLAFSLFVCAVPFALVLLAGLGMLFARPDVTAEIYAAIDRIIPYPEYAARIRDFVAARLVQMSSISEVAGVAGVIGLLFAATGLFSSLRTILNQVFRFKTTESVLVGKLWDFGLVLVVLVVTIILMVTLPVLEAAMELTQKVSWLSWLSVSGLDKGILALFSFLVLMVVFSGIYWLVPVRKPRLRTVLVGASAASLLWVIAKESFGFYVSHTAIVKHIYGLYAFMVISAFWIYYSAFILIIGAEIGQLHHERRDIDA